MGYSGRLYRFAQATLIASALALGTASAQSIPETLTVALSGDVPSLDPSKDTSPIGLNFRLNVFEALTQLDRDGSVLPRLAESWTFSEDLTQWTFTLRPGVRFHNGTELTADDVVFSLQRVQADETSPVRSFMRLVQQVEALDDRTVRFTLTQPYGIFDRQAIYLYIMSRDYFEQVGDEGFATAPIGTGPYRFVEWVRDDRLVMEAFDGYWGPQPAIRRGVFRPMPNGNARANALIAGEVDVVPSLPPSFIDLLEANPDVNIEVGPGYRVAFVSVDPNQEPFDDPRLRQAVDVAIDRTAIAERLMRNTGRPTGMMIPPSNFGYDASFTPTPYDPELAARLVREAGYDGTPINLQYPNNNFPLANEIAQAIANYLTAAGFRVELNSMEFTAFFPLWFRSETSNMYFFAFGSTQYHAETILSVLYEPGGHMRRTLPEIDALVKEQRQETDPERQRALISQAFRLGAEDRQYLPLHDMLQVYAHRASVPYEPFPDEIIRLYRFE